MAALVSVALLTCSFYPPTQLDGLGWGLRTRNMGASHYFVGESTDSVLIQFLLINYTIQPRPYVPLPLERERGKLVVELSGLDGQQVPSQGEPLFPIAPLGKKPSLPPGRMTATILSMGNFGYNRFRRPGVYELRTVLKTSEGIVTAPRLRFKVIEIGPDDVLISQVIQLEGAAAHYPLAERYRVFLQQVRIDNRIYLIYILYYGAKSGGGIYFTSRLAELPDQVEFKVSGAYGDGKPLQVAYRSSPTEWTILTVNSIDGTIARKQISRD